METDEFPLNLKNDAFWQPMQIVFSVHTRRLLRSNSQHGCRELKCNGVVRAVLAAGAAVPAFVGISDHRNTVLHVDDVERAIERAELAAIALALVDDGGHDLHSLSGGIGQTLETSGDTLLAIFAHGYQPAPVLVSFRMVGAVVVGDEARFLSR